MSILLAKLGLGALIAWAALPLLYMVARAQKSPMPDARERTLLTALAVAAALVFVPLVPLGRIPTPLLETAKPALFTSEGAVRVIPSETRDPLAALGALWVCAVLARAAVRAGRFLSLQRKLDEAGPLPARVVALRDQLSQELGIPPPEIVVSDVATLPFVTGVLTQRIFLPREIVERLPDSKLSLVLRHELLHVSRADGRTAFLAELVQLPFPGHPFAARAFSEITVARESAVDLRAAAADPHAYATLLVDVAEYHQHGVELAGSVAMGKTALSKRIQLLSSRRALGRDGLGRALLLVMAMALGSAALVLPRVSNAASPLLASDGVLRVKVGEEKVLTAESLTRIAVGDPTIADIKALSDSQVLIRGASPGKTTMLVWSTDGKRVSYLIDVR